MQNWRFRCISVSKYNWKYWKTVLSRRITSLLRKFQRGGMRFWGLRGFVFSLQLEYRKTSREKKKKEDYCFYTFSLFKCSHTWFQFSELVGHFIQKWLKATTLVTNSYLFAAKKMTILKNCILNFEIFLLVSLK